MDLREVPTWAVWIAGAIAIVIAGVFLMNANAPSTARGGRVSPQDVRVLQQMQEARQRSGSGAGSDPRLKPAAMPPSQAGSR